MLFYTSFDIIIRSAHVSSLSHMYSCTHTTNNLVISYFWIVFQIHIHPEADKRLSMGV